MTQETEERLLNVLDKLEKTLSEAKPVPKTDEPGMITIEQVCELTHMTQQSVYNKIKAGEIKGYKPGKRLLFKKEDIEKWIKRYPAA